MPVRESCRVECAMAASVSTSASSAPWLSCAVAFAEGSRISRPEGRRGQGPPEVGEGTAGGRGGAAEPRASGERNDRNSVLGAGTRANRNRVCGGNLCASLNLGSIVRTLLELDFFCLSPIFSYGLSSRGLLELLLCS